MREKSSTGHSLYDLKYHFVWVTKQRKPVLNGSVGLRLREIVREVCSFYSVEILEGAVRPDHVHLLVSCPPTFSLSKIMREIKGRTARAILQEFQELQQQFKDRHLWARGFFVATTGTVPEESIREYIKNQS